MYNQKIKSLVYKYEQLSNFYDIGPFHKCIIDDFVEEIVNMCADAVSDPYHRGEVCNVFNGE